MSSHAQRVALFCIGMVILQNSGVALETRIQPLVKYPENLKSTVGQYRGEVSEREHLVMVRQPTAAQRWTERPKGAV